MIAAGGDAVEALPATLPAQLPDNVIPIDATATARANANLPPAYYLKDGQVKSRGSVAARSPCDLGHRPEKEED